MKKKKQKEDAINGLPLTLNSATLTELLNISRETLSNWQSHPFWPKDAKTGYGKYDLKKILDWRDIYIIGDPDIAKQMAQEKLKYQKFRSEQQRLETEKLQGTLVIKEALLKKFTEKIIITKDAIWLWSKTLPPEFGLKHEDQKRVGEIIQREARRVLTTWASGIQEIKNFSQENRKNEKKEIK